MRLPLRSDVLAARRAPVRAAVAALAVLVSAAACRPSGDGRATNNGATSAPSAPAAATPPASAASAGGETVAPAATAAMPGDSTALRTAADLGRIAGSPSAKVWMIIASDFQCPYCKMWHDQTYEALRREYVDAGKIRMAYLNFPLEMHVQAGPSAEAAMCASAQGKFWEYHTALFRSAEQWGKPGDQSATYDSLATALGLDAAKFRSCTRSHVMQALIEADRDRMATRGVASTPSFFVGNQQVEGAQPLDVFRKVVDAALAQAK
jgi:protein-disulfide isomerase